MTLRERIAKLMDELAAGIPEREYCIQLSFLTMIIGEPFYFPAVLPCQAAVEIDLDHIPHMKADIIASRKSPQS